MGMEGVFKLFQAMLYTIEYRKISSFLYREPLVYVGNYYSTRKCCFIFGAYGCGIRIDSLFYK